MKACQVVCSSGCCLLWAQRQCHAAEFLGARRGSRRSAAVDFGGLPGAERLADRERFESSNSWIRRIILKQFEGALKGVGINPDKDIDTLALPSFRTAEAGNQDRLASPAGPFDMKAVIKKMTLRKIKPTKYHTANLYPMDGGFVMTFLDDSTLLFGEPSAVKLGLDTRDGEILNLDTNSDHGRHDVERGFGAVLEHPGPAGHAEYDALGAGRCGQDRRLRHGQEADAGFVLHDGVLPAA